MRYKMKQSTGKYLLLLALTLLATACTREFEVNKGDNNNGDEALVKFELNIPGSTVPAARALTGTQEDAVNTVDVLVFDRNDKFFDWRYATLRTGGGGTTVETLLISSKRNDAADIYRIVVMTNAREILHSLFASTTDGSTNKPGGSTLNGNKGLDYDVVMGKITAPSPTPVPSSSIGIPMWGELGSKVLINHGQDLGNLTLFRALARIDVGTYNGSIPPSGVETWSDLNNFKIEEVKLHNAQNSYRLAPLMTNYNSASGTITGPSLFGGASAVPVSCTDIETVGGVGLGVMRGLYMAEANVIMGGTYGDANHANRPCILVKGYYKPVGAAAFNASPSWYRIDFVTTAGALHNILRNYNYQAVITTVAGPGQPDETTALRTFNADLTVVIKTWNNAGLSGTIIDGENFLKVTPYDIELDKWAKVNNEITIETNVPETAGKSWAATAVKFDPGDPALDWLTIVSGTGNGKSGDVLKFNITQVPAGSPESFLRKARLRIVSGTITYDIIVTQTGGDADFMLRLSHSELIFPARKWNNVSSTWVAPDPQTISIAWGPSLWDYALDLSPYTGSGVTTTTAIPADANTPTFTIDPEMIPDTDPRVVANPFFERSSRLGVTVKDQAGTSTITKQVLVKQIFYSLVVSNTRDYYFQNKTYTFNIKSNTNWVADVTGNASIFVSNPSKTGVGNATAGENFAFTISGSATPNATATVTFRSPDDLFPSQSFDIVAQDELPNSFIVNPAAGSNTLSIPVKKAYRVWKYDSDLKGEHPNGDLPTGAAGAVLLWQDAPSLITSVTLNGTGATATIDVETNSTGISGNAVVAFQIDGTTYWSWSLWVTSYNPELPAGQKAIGTIVTMDRNLGAINAISGDVGSFGIYSQTGKKDIYPRALNTALTAITPIYDISNHQLTDNVDGIIKTQFAPASDNLPNAIKNPMTFYKGNYGSGSWYGQRAPVRVGMWGDNISKGEQEPCPAGWRVMHVNTFTSLPIVVRGTYAYDYGSTIGFYPTAGQIGSTGSLAGATGAYYGIYVSSTGATGGYQLQSGGIPASSIGSGSATAVSVRCVKY